MGAQVRIEWIPGYAGVYGNELVDSWAVDEARRAIRRSAARKKEGGTHRQDRGEVSQAFLKMQRKREAVREWREEILRRWQENRSFRVPAVDEVPQVQTELRKTPKELASRFFQLASGHALVAPSVKERFGWIDSDLCWWCGVARQMREHLFKGCVTWRDEIRELQK